MLGRSFLAVCAFAAMLATATATATEADEPARSRVAIDIATHPHLADATGLVNKNAVIHSNNIAVTKSNVLARQNDDITLERAEAGVEAEASSPAAPAPAIASEVPAEIVETGEKEALTVGADATTSHEQYYPYGYRYRFYYPYAGGFRYGWRYPIGYWNRYGYSLYGPGCGYRRYYGGYYYC